jgi:Ca2+-transporting ATPase
MVMFSALGIGLGQPLTAVQLLWINLLSDVWPGLALAMEPPEPDVLRRPPRDPAEPIVRRGDFRRIGFEAAGISASTLGAYGYGLLAHGPGARAGTIAFQSLTVGQLLHALSCRSEKASIFGRDRLPPNRHLSLALAGSLLLQGLSMFVPGLRALLGTTRLSLLDGAVIGGSAILPLLVNEQTKIGRGAGRERLAIGLAAEGAVRVAVSETQEDPKTTLPAGRPQRTGALQVAFNRHPRPGDSGAGTRRPW